MDISTNDTSMQIITISAGGEQVLKRLAPQFGAYKYYRLGNIAVKLVPASTLPVDPSGLSYEAGENQVDPRDQLTPGMMRITNGEDIFENITGLSDEVQHRLYDTMLLDPRWFKWMLQSGVKRHATPRYWQIGQLHQDKWPEYVSNVPSVTINGGVSSVSGTARVFTRVVNGALETAVEDGSSSPSGFFQVGHTGRLGWLPTDGYTRVRGVDFPNIASPPEVEVMKIILPKAYSTRYYYRMFVTETVYFKEPIVTFGIDDEYYTNLRPLDVFHRPSVPSPILPGVQYEQRWPTDANTGGNYGDD